MKDNGQTEQGFDAEVQGGVDLQVGPWELVAKIGAQLDNMVAKQDAAERDRQDRLNHAPVPLYQYVEQVATATTLLLPIAVTPKTPQNGRVWEVRRIVAVVLTAANATAAGVQHFLYRLPVNALVNQQVALPPNYGLVSMLGNGTGSGIAEENYSTRDLILQPGESLYYFAAGIVAGDSISVATLIDDWDGNLYLGAINR
jgi:hypothetical protein